MTGRSTIRPAGQGARKPLHHYNPPHECSGKCSGGFSKKINALHVATTPLHEKHALAHDHGRARVIRAHAPARMRMRENTSYFCSGVVDKVKCLILKDNSHYICHYKATTNRANPLQNRPSDAASVAQIARNILKSLEKVGI
jgi:hypothetical protein